MRSAQRLPARHRLRGGSQPIRSGTPVHGRSFRTGRLGDRASPAGGLLLSATKEMRKRLPEGSLFRISILGGERGIRIPASKTPNYPGCFASSTQARGVALCRTETESSTRRCSMTSAPKRRTRLLGFSNAETALSDKEVSGNSAKYATHLWPSDY